MIGIEHGGTRGDGQCLSILRKGRTMQIGDVIHLDGLKAEYNFFGRDRFSACTLPDGDYLIVALEDNYGSSRKCVPHIFRFHPTNSYLVV